MCCLPHYQCATSHGFNNRLLKGSLFRAGVGAPERLFLPCTPRATSRGVLPPECVRPAVPRPSHGLVFLPLSPHGVLGAPAFFLYLNDHYTLFKSFGGRVAEPLKLT